MAEPEASGPLWEVICSAANAEHLRQLQRRAARHGQGKAVASAFRQIVERLQRHPSESGEPSYRLSALRMQIRRIVVRPLVVHFAVCEDRPVVFIKESSLLTWHDS